MEEAPLETLEPRDACLQGRDRSSSARLRNAFPVQLALLRRILEAAPVLLYQTHVSDPKQEPGRGGLRRDRLSFALPARCKTAEQLNIFVLWVCRRERRRQNTSCSIAPDKRALMPQLPAPAPRPCLLAGMIQRHRAKVALLLFAAAERRRRARRAPPHPSSPNSIPSWPPSARPGNLTEPEGGKRCPPLA